MKSRAFTTSQRRILPLVKEHVPWWFCGVLHDGDRSSFFTDLSVRGYAAVINILTAAETDLTDFWEAVPERPPLKSQMDKQRSLS